MKRNRVLDGWRAIAILLVILDHASTYVPRPLLVGGHRIIMVWTGLGGYGVDIFFVLSGLIITSRLIDEQEASGQVDLRAFYIRRAFRILPLVVTYLITLCILAKLRAVSDFRWSDIVGSLFFFRNYEGWYRESSISTAHFWSLSIEEHFYLFWPALFLLLRRRAAMATAAVGALGCAVWRFYDVSTNFTWHLSWIHPTGISYPIRTDVRIDGLLLGAVCALMLRDPKLRLLFDKIPSWVAVAALLLGVLSVRINHLFPSLITNALIAVMLCVSAFGQQGIVSRMLTHRFLLWLGAISYSLYMWQQLFLLHPAGPLPLGWLNQFPANVLASFAMASLSFRLLEQPAIAYGRRVSGAQRQKVALERQPVRS
jgi:peptidoglycan/LPS O-acetylase OafA/YrhL